MSIFHTHFVCYSQNTRVRENLPYGNPLMKVYMWPVVQFVFPWACCRPCSRGVQRLHSCPVRSVQPASAKYLDWSWCLLQARLQCAEPCFHWLRLAFSEYASHLLIDCVGCRLQTWPLRTIGNMSPTSTPPDPGLPSLLTLPPWES